MWRFPGSLQPADHAHQAASFPTPGSFPEQIIDKGLPSFGSYPKSKALSPFPLVRRQTGSGQK